LIASCGTATEATTTTAASATTTSPTTTTTEGTTTTTVDTSEPEASEQSFDFDVPFTATVPSDLRRASDSAPRLLFLQRGQDLLAFSTFGEDSVEAWRLKLTENPDLVATEPTEVEIDGAEGFWVDVTLSDQAGTVGCFGQGRCTSLIEQLPGWVVVEGLPNRIWVVDVQGTAVFIAAESNEDGFEDWVAEVEEVLATVDWGREA
jgi:hypothetical protein